MEQTEIIIPEHFVSSLDVAESHGLACSLIGLSPEREYTGITFSLADGEGDAVSVPDVTDGGWRSGTATFDGLEAERYYRVVCEYTASGETYSADAIIPSRTCVKERVASIRTLAASDDGGSGGSGDVWREVVIPVKYVGGVYKPPEGAD
jgi:hypothetical protein